MWGLFRGLDGFVDLFDQIGGSVVAVVVADGDRRHALLGVVEPAVAPFPSLLRHHGEARFAQLLHQVSYRFRHGRILHENVDAVNKNVYRVHFDS